MEGPQGNISSNILNMSHVLRELVWKAYVVFSFDQNIYKEGITLVQ
jgi:hypothetical protein